MGTNKKTMINLFCSIMVLATNLIISFWLSPYIVKHIGVEANGFVTLANNFVSYAQLIVTALNSMAARFITVEYVKKDYKKANLYYNSVFWGNLLIVVILILPAIVLIAKLDFFINVSEALVNDVKVLFGFVFLNFFITTGLPNWECATYVKNRLDRKYIPQMIAAMIRCLFIICVFIIASPKVYYVGIAATVMTIINLVAYYHNMKKLVPELKIYLIPDKIVCGKKELTDLVNAGIWNSISSVGTMLLTGCDLLICNIFLGATQMGVLSLAKVIPHYMAQLSNSIRSAFEPELTIDYAKGHRDEMLKNINRAMKITSIVLTIPIAIVVALGEEFFSLWVPTQDAQLLQILSILSILSYIFTSGVQILFNVFPTVNKVKPHSVALIIGGLVSICVTIFLTQTTRFGIYAVAGVSSICNIIRNVFFVVPITARYLGYKWNKFYPQVLLSIGSTLGLLIIFSCMDRFLPSDTWIELILSAGLMAFVGLIVNIMFILDKTERIYLLNKFANIINLKSHFNGKEKDND